MARRAGVGVPGGLGQSASRPAGGFGRLLCWTTLGAVLPGTSLVAAGRRRVGASALGLVFLLVLPLAVFAATGEMRWIVLQVAVRPGALLIVAALAVVGGLLWAALIVTGHVALRGSLNRIQQVTSVLLVLVLVAAVLVPAGTVARYAMAQRSLLLGVFDQQDDAPRDPGLAAPDVSAEDPWHSTPRVNVLLIGSDAGVGRRGTRTDTLIAASIDSRRGDTVLFSLPRNLERAPFPQGSPGASAFPGGFYCPGHRECLLNGIWTWAEDNAQMFPGDPEPGLTATRQAVGETLGLSIDYYAKVDLRGFEDLVDAMGGLEIDVPRRLPVPGGHLEPGRQILFGDEVLAYTRSRSDSDDYERMERQRCVIGQIIDQANPRRLALQFPQLASAAQRNLSTDVGLGELDAFVDLAMRMQKGSVRSLAFTDEVIDSADPDLEFIRESVRRSLEVPEPVPSAPTADADAMPLLDLGSLTPDGNVTVPTRTSRSEGAVAEDLGALCG